MPTNLDKNKKLSDIQSKIKDNTKLTSQDILKQSSKFKEIVNKYKKQEGVSEAYGTLADLMMEVEYGDDWVSALSKDKNKQRDITETMDKKVSKLLDIDSGFNFFSKVSNDASQFSKLVDKYGQQEVKLKQKQEELNKKSKPINWSKRLSHLETMDFQNRGGNPSKSGISNVIEVRSCSGDRYGAIVTGSFKFTEEQVAKDYMESYIKKELGKEWNNVDIKVTARQTGDYYNDWVDASVIITPKKTK